MALVVYTGGTNLITLPDAKISSLDSRCATFVGLSNQGIARVDVCSER
jgi:hypothetical protein